MNKDKKSNWTNIAFIIFFFGTIIFIIAAPIYIVDKIDKESKMPRKTATSYRLPATGDR